MRAEAMKKSCDDDQVDACHPNRILTFLVVDDDSESTRD